MLRVRRTPAREIGDVVGGGLGVDERLERGGSAEIQVGVVLPGEADAAVHLDVELRGLVAGGQGERGRHGGGEGELVATLLGGAGGVPHGRRGQLGGDQHVGAMVLDGLEHGDGPAELHAHLGVGGGLLGALGGDAGGLGGHEEPRQVDQHLPPPGDHPHRRTVERHPGGAPGRVEVGRYVDGDAARRRVDHDGIVARRQHENVGEAAAQDRRRRPGGPPVAHRDVGRQPHASEHRSVGQPAQQACRQVVGPDLVDDRAGDDRRHERPGRQRPAQLLDHHDELGQAEARAAPRLGEVQAEPAQGGQVAPERGERLGLGFEQGPGGPSGIVFGEEIRGGLPKGPVVFGDGDRHA